MTFQLLLFPNFKEKAVTLSYDDGMVFDKRLIEIMTKNGIKGTFNLNSGIIYDQKVQPEEFKDLYIKSGNEVAIHGEKHLSLAAVKDEVVLRDIINDKVALENYTGGLVTGMAYANGSYDDRVVEVLKTCGISYSRTTKSTESFNIDDDWLRLKPTCHHGNPKLMELVDKFLDNTKSIHYWWNQPKLFYLWGHSYEFDRQNNWNIIEEFCEKVGNREDIWYATNIEIYRYVEAFKSLVYSANGKYVYNPTCIDVHIKDGENKVIVPAGKTVELGA